MFQKELLEIKRFSLIRTWTISVSTVSHRILVVRVLLGQIEQKLLSGCSNVHGPLWPKHLLMKAMVSVLLFDKL